MKATNFFRIIIVILLLVNIATLSVVWLRPDRADHRHEGPPGPAFFLERELRLDEAQRDRYKRMREQHHETVMSVRARAAGYRHTLNARLGDPAPDSLYIRSYCDSIAQCQREIEQVTFYHFQELRALCRPDQQRRFDAVIQEAVDMLAGAGR